MCVCVRACVWCVRSSLAAAGTQKNTGTRARCVPVAVEIVDLEKETCFHVRAALFKRAHCCQKLLPLDLPRSVVVHQLRERRGR